MIERVGATPQKTTPCLGARIPPLHGEGGSRSEPGGVLATTISKVRARLVLRRRAFALRAPHPAAFGGRPPRQGEGFALHRRAASLPALADRAGTAALVPARCAARGAR